MDDVVNHLNETVDQFTNATLNRSNVEDDLFTILTNTSKDTEDFIRSQFKAVDKILMDEGLGSKAVVPVGILKDKLNRLLRKYGRRVKAGGDPDGDAIAKMVRAVTGKPNVPNQIEDLSGSLSFEQLYDVRQALSNIRMDGRTSGTIRNELTNVVGDGLLDSVDQIFTNLGQGGITTGFKRVRVKDAQGNVIPGKFEQKADINTELFETATRELTGERTQALKDAAEQFGKARGAFFAAKSAQEKLFDVATIKKFEASARKEGVNGAIDPNNIKIYNEIIKPNSGKQFRNFMDYIREYAKQGGEAGEVVAQTFRQRALNQFLKDAVERSNLNSVSKDFNGTAFKKAIDDLGDTADELFGTQKDDIIKLANEFDATRLKGISGEDALAQLENLNPNASFLDNMKELQKLQKQLDAQQANDIQKKVLAGDFKEIGPIETAELVIKPTTKAKDLKPIIDYYKANDTNGYQKIQSFYINRMIDDFGESVMTDGKTLNAFAERILKQADGGKLQVIFGKEMGESMEEFANILKFNAKSAEGGDLVAANIAASPFQNVGKLIKFSILGRKMLSKGYYDNIVEQYKGLAKGLTPREKATKLGNIIAQSLSQMPGQFSQEGLREAEKQTEALLENTGVTQTLSDLRKQATPILNQTVQSVNQTRNLASAPNVTPPAGGTQLAGVDITNPANAFSLGLNPSDIAIAQRTRGTA